MVCAFYLYGICMIFVWHCMKLFLSEPTNSTNSSQDCLLGIQELAAPKSVNAMCHTCNIWCLYSDTAVYSRLTSGSTGLLHTLYTAVHIIIILIILTQHTLSLYNTPLRGAESGVSAPRSIKWCHQSIGSNKNHEPTRKKVAGFDAKRRS